MAEIIQEKMSIYEKLQILTDAAKYDVACTSSGVERKGDGTGIGNCSKAGICHSFSADGRCISLLKILFTNECIYDCKYCVNRSSNDVIRTSFTPDEICTLTMEFYRRNYIEGLFLSSGILKNPNYTMELLAPHKSRKNILAPMRLVQEKSKENRQELTLYKSAPRFVPAGQSTQMIIGASPETDYQILRVAESLYQKFGLKRVFYSAFVAVNEDKALPARTSDGPPLLREHRLYQADWLLRYYKFEANELLNEKNPNFNIFLDPKCNWALNHLEYFPVEVNRASYDVLLRVPGIGYKSAGRIVKARRFGSLGFEDLRKMGVVLKRALYFITCSGKMMYKTKIEEDYITRNLLNTKERLPDSVAGMNYQQLSLFDDVNFTGNQIVTMV